MREKGKEENERKGKERMRDSERRERDPKKGRKRKGMNERGRQRTTQGRANGTGLKRKENGGQSTG